MPFKEVPPLYTIWQGMRRRCMNPNYSQWADYGGRGISICKRWDSFRNFIEDMGPRPTSLHTLDRKNNDGNYTPRNCQWSTRKKQQRNQRATRKVNIEGIEYIAADLAEKYSIKVDTIVERAASGLPFSSVTIRGHLRWDRGRPAAKCKHGHDYTPENTRVLPSGMRACRKCLRASSSRLYHSSRDHYRTP